MDLATYFDRAILINLARRPDRLKAFFDQEQMKDWPFRIDFGGEMCSNDKRPGHRKCPGRSTTTVLEVRVMAESHSNTPWKKIPLTQGQVAIVDADDYEFLMQWKWQAMRRKDRRNAPWYAVRTVRKAGQKNSLLQMASLIMKSSAKIDHANRNSLDNRKSNLRECTASQNAANRPVQSNNTSGHPGVSWDRKLKKWRAYITKDQVRIGLGFFVDLHSAILTRRAAARKLFGVFSNEP